jgi:hypothetical protein
LVLQAQGDAASHLLEVNTSFALPPQRIDITGDFTFDAVSNDGARVYLIQHAGGGHYFVRDYAVGAGLDPTVIFDKSDGSLAMSGVRLAGVPSPDGTWLYSVYARKDKSAFIHELDLGGPIAFCVDLPGPGYASDRSAMRWSLTLAEGGGRLFAVNGALGVIAEVIPPDSTGDGRTASVHGLTGDTSEVLTADGKALIVAGRGGVQWLHANNLRVFAATLDSWTVAGLAPAPGGGRVYAVSDTGEVALLDASGHTMATFDSGLGAAAALLSVERLR